MEMMTKRYLVTLFKSLLLQFFGEADPLLSLLEWMTQRLMNIKADNKVGAKKRKYSNNRHTSRAIGSDASTLGCVLPT